MSLLGSIAKFAGKATKFIAPLLAPTPAGMAVGVLGAVGGSLAARKSTGLRALPGAGNVQTLPRATSSVGTRKIMVDNMGNQIYMPRRRRAKGITGSQLKGFRRVSKLLENYCHMIKTTGAKKCR